jgi:enamine deaminase RidA (YjgF/YER057c/UK114 family)
MEYFYKTIQNVDIEISMFIKDGVNEIHLLAKTKKPKSFDNQLEEIFSALNAYLTENNIPHRSVVFTRYFVSDYANHDEELSVIKERTIEHFNMCAVSIVQQPPLNDNKVVVWAYIINDNNRETFDIKIISSNSLIVRRGNYNHIWSTHLLSYNGYTEPFNQTTNIFTDFSDKLSQYGYSIKDNCIRTWLFIKDIDFNYMGVVKARKEFFEKLGMTKDTHFISSTGIEGRHANPDAIVFMDAYSIGGVAQEQIKFLEALENLNRTHEYGVTFERGTSIDFGDRRHIYISGTASINNRGEVVHKKDVNKQIERTIANVSALLDDADATMEDVAQMIVYLRNTADTEAVNKYFARNYQNIPKVVVLAPVCRPEWLVEIECIAIKATDNSAYSNF